ncbi:hypothetical protein R1flu_010663 [Riccia fluitans]|uniref:C2 NT-type domain-containing protein n=1 Tax=Riccia fluitans TaxID=41844 RepID=A0ABD1Z5L3_9MARC
MVLGLGSKKKGQPVKLEFLIFIQEIKPWKPAQSAKTPLVLSWERGDKRSGRTQRVVPNEDGKVEFNEEFKLQAKLVREPEGKGKNQGVVKFQKKTVNFQLLDAVTDRQLARCVVDLGEYGDADAVVQANAPLSTGKKVVTSGSPTLYFKIGVNGKKEEPRTSFSARVSFSSKAAALAAPKSAAASVKPGAEPAASAKPVVEPVLDEETRKSLVAALMSDEDDDNDSIASFTDDEEEATPESTPRTPSRGASSSKTAVSESSNSKALPPPSPARQLPPPSPARPEVARPTNPSSHSPPGPRPDASKVSQPPPSPRPDASKASAPPSQPSPVPRLDPSKGSLPPSHPPPPRPDPARSPPSHPPPPRPDASKASAPPPSHAPPVRPDPPKASPPSTMSQTPKPDVFKGPPATSITSPARTDEPKSSSQSMPPKRDSVELSRNAANPTAKQVEGSRTSGMYSPGNKSPTSSADSSSNVTAKSRTSPSVHATAKPVSSSPKKHSPEEVEERQEKQRADLFATDTSLQPRIAADGSKSPVSTSESPRAAIGLSSSGSINVAGGGSKSSTAPIERPRSPVISKESSRGNPPSDRQAVSEAAGSDISKTAKGDVLPDKDRMQKSAIPLPPTSAKAAAAAAATAYASRRSYRSRGNSFDFSFDSSSEDSLSPPNGGRSPALSPILHTQPGSLHSRSPSYSGPPRPQKNLLSQVPDVSREAKGTVASKEETLEELKVIPSKDEGRRSYDRREEKSEIRKTPDVRREENGQVKAHSQKREESEPANEDEGEAGSVVGSAKANFAKAEKKALDELRNKVANAEAKVVEANQRAQEQLRQYSLQMERLEGELRETGAMEVALYCVVAEHGNSSSKLHTPARRLARLYMHAWKHWTPERKAGTAKNCIAGLVTVAKACGTDVSRLSFWWSNVVVLRSVMVQAYDPEAVDASESGNTDSATSSSSSSNGASTWARRTLTSVPVRKSFSRQDSKLLSPKPLPSDWHLPATFITALEKIEGWIYTKIIESLWWQAMIPKMQKGVDPSAPTSPRGLSGLSPATLGELTNKSKEDLDMTGIVKKPERSSSVSLPELGDARQGNVSVEIWKRAMKDALTRLCPVRGAGHECGCLPMLIKTAIEGLCARLDVALFNAILRNIGDDVPTDPISDPVSDPSVLPISPGGLSFGGGSQLKNVVVTWSTFIHGLVSLKEPMFPPEADDGSTENMDDPEKLPKLFNLIKATGDLLMLPKDFLMDKAFRKEICPMLSLHLIRRILMNFVPDEFAPDPISPSLLAALNAEAAIEKQRLGEADDESSVAMAKAPPLVYAVPSAFYVWSWIGEGSADPAGWGRSSNSLLRRGYTSDEDLDVMEQLQENNASSKLDLILASTRAASVPASNGDLSNGIPKSRQSYGVEAGSSKRFQLLKPVWGSH